jgi:hypothetical protein
VNVNSAAQQSEDGMVLNVFKVTTTDGKKVPKVGVPACQHASSRIHKLLLMVVMACSSQILLYLDHAMHGWYMRCCYQLQLRSCKH